MKKETILEKAKQNPEHTLCLFTKDDFKVAKAFWMDKDDGTRLLPIWVYHLQQMVLEKEPIKYLEKFL